MFERDPEFLYFGTTPLENTFISEYLPDAKGDYVKVYIMALYHAMRGDPDIGVEQIAYELNMSASEVEAAIRYWERRALISTGADGAPAVFHSATKRLLTGTAALFKPDNEFVAFSESVYALFGEDRKITPAEVSSAFDWVQELDLSAEAVLMLLSHMKLTSGKNFSFKRAESLAVRMHESNVQSGEDAEHFLSFETELRKNTQKILRRIGRRSVPTDDEMALYRKWNAEWGFSPDAIESACGLMTASNNPSFKYLDGILQRMHEKSNIHTPDEIAQSESDFSSAKAFAEALGLRSVSKTTQDIYRDMLSSGMPDSVILIAARECKRLNRSSLDSVQELVLSWQEQGLDTEEKVTEHLNSVRTLNTMLRKVYDACGHSGRPTQADRKTLSDWYTKGLSDDLILYAASLASKAEGAKMSYIKKVLENWQSAGIRTVEEASKSAASPKERPAKQVSAQQYAQREYTEEELNQMLNPDDFFRKAREK